MERLRTYDVHLLAFHVGLTRKWKILQESAGRNNEDEYILRLKYSLCCILFLSFNFAKCLNLCVILKKKSPSYVHTYIFRMHRNLLFGTAILFAQLMFIYSFQAESQLLYNPGVYFGGATLQVVAGGTNSKLFAKLGETGRDRKSRYTIDASQLSHDERRGEKPQWHPIEARAVAQRLSEVRGPSNRFKSRGTLRGKLSFAPEICSLSLSPLFPLFLSVALVRRARPVLCLRRRSYLAALRITARRLFRSAEWRRGQ